jgi:hypothetical protein
VCPPPQRDGSLTADDIAGLGLARSLLYSDLVSAINGNDLGLATDRLPSSVAGQLGGSAMRPEGLAEPEPRGAGSLASHQFAPRLAGRREGLVAHLCRPRRICLAREPTPWSMLLTRTCAARSPLAAPRGGQ